MKKMFASYSEPSAVSRRPMADMRQIAAPDWQTDQMSIVEFV